jgi:hypothetical protein
MRVLPMVPGSALRLAGMTGLVWNPPTFVFPVLNNTTEEDESKSAATISPLRPAIFLAPLPEIHCAP